MSKWGAIVFGIGFCIEHFASVPLLSLIVAIAAGVWGVGVLIGR